MLCTDSDIDFIQKKEKKNFLLFKWLNQELDFVAESGALERQLPTEWAKFKQRSFWMFFFKKIGVAIIRYAHSLAMHKLSDTFDQI